MLILYLVRKIFARLNPLLLVRTHYNLRKILSFFATKSLDVCFLEHSCPQNVHDGQAPWLRTYFMDSPLKHGRRQRGQGGRGLPWIFIHDIANVFFNKHSLCENILTLTNHRSSLLYWLTLRDRGDYVQVGIWVQIFFAGKWSTFF